MDGSLPHTEFKYANLYISFREEITVFSSGKIVGDKESHSKGS